jgi:hypothetical protein
MKGGRGPNAAFHIETPVTLQVILRLTRAYVRLKVVLFIGKA